MSKTSTDFSLKRIDALARCVVALGACGVWYHRIVIEGAHNLPQEGAALLLPKHHAYRDILLEGVLLRRITGRYATYVMKTGLWGVIERLGGLRVVRPKDIRRIADRQERRREITRARAANQNMQDYLSGLYSHGEVVISHPEGMRIQGEMGLLQKEIIEHVVKVEQQLGIRVPLIPIGMEYESYARPKARAYFRVDEPFYADEFADVNGVMDYLDDRLRILSGLSQ
jgi:1-acyl-sn-glycerol-3-phosphate acyltransferase